MLPQKGTMAPCFPCRKKDFFECLQFSDSDYRAERMAFPDHGLQVPGILVNAAVLK